MIHNKCKLDGNKYHKKRVSLKSVPNEKKIGLVQIESINFANDKIDVTEKLKIVLGRVEK